MKPSNKDRIAEATEAALNAAKAVDESAKSKITAMPTSGKSRRKVDDEEDEEPKENRPLYSDLTAWLDGALVQELPTVANVGCRCLLYAAAVNEIHGEPGLGKSNVSHACAIATIKSSATATVLILDPEDSPGGFVKQMRSLSNDDPEIIAAIRAQRVRYIHNPDPEMMKQAIKDAINDRPTLVIMDGLAELLAAEDYDEDSAKDVLKFFRRRVRPFCEKAGSAVLISDHVTKAGNGGWARGSGAKKGRYDGVSYEIRLGKAYSPTVAGFVKLVVTKDRKGGIGPKDTHVIDLHFSPSEKDGCTNISWEAPAFVEKDNSAPMVEMEGDIMDYLKSLPKKKDSMGNIRKAVKGRGQTIDQVAMGMAAAGKLTLTQVGTAKFLALPEIKQMDPKDFQQEKKQNESTGAQVPTPSPAVFPGTTRNQQQKTRP